MANDYGQPINLDPNQVLDWLRGNNLQPLTDQSGIDLSGRYPAFEIAKRMLGPLANILFMQTANRQALMPLLLQAINQHVTSLLNPEQQVSEANAATDATAASDTTSILQRLKSEGVGIGTVGGAAQSVKNRASADKNATREAITGPEGMAKSTNALAQLLGMGNPNADLLGTLQSIMTGTPRNMSGLQAIGGALGSLAGFIPGAGAAGGGGLLANFGASALGKDLSGLGWYG